MLFVCAKEKANKKKLEDHMETKEEEVKSYFQSFTIHFLKNNEFM